MPWTPASCACRERCCLGASGAARRAPQCHHLVALRVGGETLQLQGPRRALLLIHPFHRKDHRAS
eukprot:1078031-Prymnesium_polylepis.1